MRYLLICFLLSGCHTNGIIGTWFNNGETAELVFGENGSGIWRHNPEEYLKYNTSLDGSILPFTWRKLSQNQYQLIWHNGDVELASIENGLLFIKMDDYTDVWKNEKTIDLRDTNRTTHLP